ncbi:hypothetical protein C0J52_05649 [Blattella germanica]|nr:hypothetical protein C0J52_05649 [Blattella germanica]
MEKGRLKVSTGNNGSRSGWYSSCSNRSQFVSLSVVSEMANVDHNVSCVLEFPRSESQIVVQPAFCTKFGIEPPTRISIKHWFTQF